MLQRWSTYITTKLSRLFGSRHALYTLAVLSFLESAIAPIVVTDAWLVSMILAHREQWKRYVVVASTTSVVGGMVGYCIGAFLFQIVALPLVHFFGWEAHLAQVVALVSHGAVAFTFIGAVMPIPYKITAIVAGLLHVHFFVFAGVSLIARTLRYGVIAYLTQYAHSKRGVLARAYTWLCMRCKGKR